MRLLRRPWVAVATVLVLLLGVAFLTQVVPYRQIIDANSDVAEARAHLEALSSENSALQSDVDALATDGEIERLAREKLGYVRPGETAYVVLDPPEVAEATSEPEPESDAEPRTWVERVWDFLTGADVGHDDAG